MRGRFARRFGCLFGLINFFVFLIITSLVVLLANQLGLLNAKGSFWWAIPGAVVLLFFGGAALFFAWRNLRRMSAPLGDLIEGAERIKQGDFSPHVPERGTPEVRSLVRTFNGMAERLKVTEEQRRDLMADISHELRTPITVIQGNLEGIIDGVYTPDVSRLRSVLEETQILSRLVDDLRTLALAESSALQLKKEPTDMAVLINETAAAFKTQADAASVEIKVTTDNNAPLLNIDPERIRQVLTNLTANSLRYTARGGTIKIVLEKSSGDEAVMRVEDNGAGIAPEVLPNIFQRFYKTRDSSGTGLGLPIARHLVEAHGGKITAESEVGKGTVVRVSLPREEF
jgi:two-component system, OmpR family, sensor histidine kinase BaeS